MEEGNRETRRRKKAKKRGVQSYLGLFKRMVTDPFECIMD